MTNEEILRLLKETKQGALALYSNFHVAAVLETTEGEFFTGINIESSSYGLTICAERVALFKALSDGKRAFKRIYILADSKGPCPPCGACRQVLMDFAPNVEVVMYAEDGEKIVETIDALLPFAFNGDKLV